MESKEFLSSWFENYIKNRDLIPRAIVDIDNSNKEYPLVIKYKTGNAYVIVETVIRDFHRIVSRIREDDQTFLIVYNIKENLDAITDNWDAIKDMKMLKIYFVNPFLDHENKWILSPHIHSKIADNSTFKRGLVSLFEGVEPLEFNEIDKRIAGI